MAFEEIPSERWIMATGKDPNARPTTEELQKKVATQGFVEGWGTIIADGVRGLAETISEAIKERGKKRIQKTQEKS